MESDFTSNLKYWKVAPNTSNQNFHNKMIRAISLTHKVEVVSIRSINKNFAKKELPKSKAINENITWNYIKVKQNRLYKLLKLNAEIRKTLSINKEDIIIVDTLNLTLLKNAFHLSKISKAKIIGICTDSPNNISFISRRYKKNLFKYGRQLDSYVCLTEKINKLYNRDKPYVIIDGINEELPFDKPIINGNYIYFGGSLMHEYGVYELIKAFNELNLNDIDLVICGHHEQPDFKAMIQNKKIHYLGVKPYLEVANLEHYSLVAINPRPINPAIDEYSIPSKTLEFMINDALTVCVNNELLSKYEDCIIWAKSGSSKDIKEAIIKALSLGDDRTKYIQKAKMEVQKRTSFESVNNILKKLF